MKVRISKVDRYPFFELADSIDKADKEIELSDDEAADLKRVFAEFEAWQVRLRAMASPAKPTEQE